MSALVSVERLEPPRAPARGAVATALLGTPARDVPFLSPLPRDPEAWARAIQAAAETETPAPRAWTPALVARQRTLGAGRQAEANARLLSEPGTLAVVTGQQPGLLGGPLLTLHKAAGAIHLARQLDDPKGRRVVPVFWLASEDHDLDEANQLLVLDGHGQPRRFSLPMEADGRSLMHRVPPPGALDALLADVAALLPDTARAREALELVRPLPEDTFASASARALLALLGDSGLVMVEPDVLLPFAGDVLGLLLEQAQPIRDALVAAGARLGEAGFPVPLAPGPDEAPLFMREQEGGPRLRVRVADGGRVLLKDSPHEGDVQALARRLRRQPLLGSGDAAGRVFVQNRMLPVLAYVAGPTEIAYLAQVGAAHEALGLPFPLAIPRPAATWIDRKALEAAAAFGADVAGLLARGAEASAPPTLGEGDEDLAQELDAWAAAAGALPAGLRARLEGEGAGPRALARAAERLGADVARHVEQVRQAYARDRGVGRARWVRLQALLWPRERPQERGLSPLSLVSRYGAQALREGLMRLDPLQPGHHLLRLGEEVQDASEA